MTPRVPVLLESLVVEGRWPSTEQEERMQNLTSRVARERIAAFAPGEETIFLCRPPFRTVAARVASGDSFWKTREAAPEGLDRELAILIGDFGLGSDSPIVLDYRAGSPPPRVLRLRWVMQPEGHQNEWVEVASSFERFVELLGI